MTATMTLGDHLRLWRQRRRMSQLDLALEAEISQKHLSFVESGRSAPSRDMVLRLAQRLELPLRERNAMLLAAGYAPAFPERRLDDPALQPALAMVSTILAAHEPYPALAVDRHWVLVDQNAALARILEPDGVDPRLLRPPVNVLRLSLHPDGLAPRILNLATWRQHLLERLGRQVATTGDAVLIRLLAELSAYPSAGSPEAQDPHRPDEGGEPGLAAPLVLASRAGPLALISCTTVFGTPTEVTLSELSLETFLPADAATAAILLSGLEPAAPVSRPARSSSSGRRG